MRVCVCLYVCACVCTCVGMCLLWLISVLGRGELACVCPGFNVVYTMDALGSVEDECIRDCEGQLHYVVLGEMKALHDRIKRCGSRARGEFSPVGAEGWRIGSRCELARGYEFQMYARWM